MTGYHYLMTLAEARRHGHVPENVKDNEIKVVGER
jgi:hypothetical protein